MKRYTPYILFLAIIISFTCMGQSSIQACFVWPDSLILRKDCDFSYSKTGMPQVKDSCKTFVVFTSKDFDVSVGGICKVVREFTILNWLTEEKYNFNQVIKQVDTFDLECQPYTQVNYYQGVSQIIQAKDIILDADPLDQYSFQKFSPKAEVQFNQDTAFLTQLNIYRNSDRLHCITNLTLTDCPSITQSNFVEHPYIYIHSSTQSYRIEDLFTIDYTCLDVIDSIHLIYNQNPPSDQITLPLDKGNSTISVKARIHINGTITDMPLQFYLRNCGTFIEDWINAPKLTIDLNNTTPYVFTANEFIDTTAACSQEYQPYEMKVWLGTLPYAHTYVFDEEDLGKYFSARVVVAKDGLNQGTAFSSLHITSSDIPNCLELLTNDRAVQAGERVKIPFRFNNLNGIDGFLIWFDFIGMQLDTLEFLDFETFKPSDYSHDKTKLGILVAEANGKFNGNYSTDTIFNIYLDVLRDGLLSDLLSIRLDTFLSHAVFNDVNIPVKLIFDSLSSLEDKKENYTMKLFPNPSGNHEIYLSSEEDVCDQLRIYGVDGRHIDFNCKFLQDRVLITKLTDQNPAIVRLQTAEQNLTWKWINHSY